jgi:hypothetical protein
MNARASGLPGAGRASSGREAMPMFAEPAMSAWLCERDRSHSGHRAEPRLEHLDRPARGLARLAVLLGIHAEDEHAARVEARIDAHQVPQGAGEERGGAQEEERQRDLRRDESAPEPRGSGRSRAAPRAGLKRRCGARGAQRGHHGEEQAAE